MKRTIEELEANSEETFVDASSSKVTLERKECIDGKILLENSKKGIAFDLGCGSGVLSYFAKDYLNYSMLD